MGYRLLKLKMSHPSFIKDSEWNKLVEQYNALPYEEQEKIYKTIDKKSDKALGLKNRFMYDSCNDELYALTSGGFIGIALCSAYLMQYGSIAWTVGFYASMGAAVVFARGAFSREGRLFPTNGRFATFVRDLCDNNWHKFLKVTSPSILKRKRENAERKNIEDMKPTVAVEEEKKLDEHAPDVAVVEEKPAIAIENNNDLNNVRV